MEAVNINKITWFARQLQHKTGEDSLKLSPATDGYVLSTEGLFVLDCYTTGIPTMCIVSQDSGLLHIANIEQGKHYRLSVSERVVLFKITSRKIWFFDSVDAMIADVMKKERVR